MLSGTANRNGDSMNVAFCLLMKAFFLTLAEQRAKKSCRKKHLWPKTAIVPDRLWIEASMIVQ
jgi:hypothetical protein